MTVQTSPLLVLHLIRQVYIAVLEGTHSFEEDNIGEDLAYLMGAITRNTHCEWHPARPFVELLRELFPDKHHPVWAYIILYDPEDKKKGSAASFEFLNDAALECIQEHGLKPNFHALIAACYRMASMIAENPDEEDRVLKSQRWELDARLLERIEAKLLND
jgi:hypothetical protein